MINKLVEIDESKAVLQKVVLPDCNKSVNVYLKRIDLVHPDISGNKWYKLKYNLEYAKEQGFKTILTFGGAYSNHIAATSAAGKLFGFNTIGIIRGEKHLPLNPTLEFANEHGMHINYYSRSFFKKRNTPEFFNEIKNEFPDAYILPEGGTNELAVKGTAEIMSNIDIEYDLISVACGTGGTIAGIIAGSKSHQKIIGFSALKGGEFLNNDVKNLLRNYTSQKAATWIVNSDFHFGGYAKITKQLIEFKAEFEKLNHIELDYIYTSKMLFGLKELLNKGEINRGKNVIAIHTGGIQGNKGMMTKVQNALKRT